MLDNAIPADDATGEDDALEVVLTRPRAGVVLLTVAGELDTLTAPQFEALLRRLLDEPEPVLAVDLTEVRFLASSGLAVLVDGARRAEETGRRLRLVADARPVVRPLEITGTDLLFDLYTDTESALAT